MPAYWLNCFNCSKDFKFGEITEYNSLGSYLWNVYFEKDNDQSLLTLKCPECKGALNFTYDFPGHDLIFKVKHIVFRTSDNHFYQMLWETFSIDTPKEPIYDFKYMNGNNQTGLVKPVIFREEELKQLIEIFNKKCHPFLQS